MQGVRFLGVACAICWLTASWVSYCQTASAQGFSNSPHSTPAHRQAITRGMELLRASVDRYPEHRQCFSCHHQAVPLFTFRLAVQTDPFNPQVFSWRKDAQRVERMMALTRSGLERDLARLRDGDELDGRGLTLGYAMWTLDVSASRDHELADRLIDVALSTQQEDGRWRIHSHRPPASSSDRMATALVCASLLQHIQDHPRAAAMADALCRARWWHLNQELPADTEDAVGMLWSRYVFVEMDRKLNLFSSKSIYGPDVWWEWKQNHLSSAQRARELYLSATEPHTRGSESLWRLQNPDGGWGQRLGDESDAYATGLSLIVLANADNDYKIGRVFHSHRYQRGIAWLIENQLEDGSWHVSSRASPVQEFFDNGDPHETDQFISMMATAWATAALCNAWQGQPKPLQTAFAE